ncbi:LacI family DNA-binding transcriptional regulator [uncultured Clostridium sp.]|uniref:LacI family DNA-binding transcriptional regulator n=1 Tax=uncultured Clostridium sp. TaxID=59620 RepID=UPI0028EC300C|nr:LacI family DNA-binding transcriptional regulator [uncultured Clostridium sp.]
MEKITIKDVAKKANVSTATVSRVINGDYPVSKEAKERVLEAINVLNYTPNAVARSLKIKKTDTIGLIVPDISNPYFMKMAKGIEKVVAKEGYSLLMGSTHDNPDNEVELLDLFHERRVEAIVLATCQNNKDNIESLINLGINIIMVDRKISGVKTAVILLDNFESSYNITEKLIKNGHKEILTVNGNPTISTEQDRYLGFLKALEDNNIEVNKNLQLRNILSKEKAYDSIIKFLSEEIKFPTSIYCTNHYLLEGTLLALKKLKIRVPEDVSLVCFGETNAAKLLKPKITTVSYDSYKLGEKCGHIVLDKINKRLKDGEIEYIIQTKIFGGESIKEKSEN